MTDLASRDYSRSRAVLMGTWECEGFSKAPAVERSFTRMRDLLLNPVCGPWPRESVVEIANRPTLGTTCVEVTDALMAATDVAFFYYVGHGIYDHRERLCLTVGDTKIEAPYPAITGLLFETVREAFHHSPATVKIAVLDCCYSGLAAKEFGHLSATRLPPISGTYLLMSSSAFEMSWYELEDTAADAQTCFTKAFVETVREGVGGAPPGLTLDHIYGVVADRLVEDGKPEPHRRIADDAAAWVFAHNNAPASPPEPGTDPDAMFREAYRWETEEGIERLHLIEARYRAAAEAGHTQAMNRLGQIAEGRVQARMQGIEPGPVDGRALLQATYWYTKAAEAGDPVGPMHLGQLYEEQYKDLDRALYWYGLAAQRNNSAAHERLAGLEQRIRLGLVTDGRPGEDEQKDDPGEEEPPDAGQPVGGPQQPGPRPPAGFTVADLTARLLFHQWLDREWNGDQQLAIAQCHNVLITATGGDYGEWSTLKEADQHVLITDFMYRRPPRASVALEARRYYQEIGPGNLRAHAEKLRRGKQ
ncbi:caspase, EACC1-associated type [Streptomyces sp. WAC00469]|uniref:caspase, EACC1-associated type n=1 Tax=Streptomyces sp. WAC00469 TaxID=2487415 RepID=UPI000F7356F1|nr:caspase family protein [Streptomyces sp. WAC00469]RSR96459.1 sel1 repeat family protein [Streptomyces sp. WAC00469]